MDEIGPTKRRKKRRRPGKRTPGKDRRHRHGDLSAATSGRISSAVNVDRYVLSGSIPHIRAISRDEGASAYSRQVAQRFLIAWDSIQEGTQDSQDWARASKVLQDLHAEIHRSDATQAAHALKLEELEHRHSLGIGGSEGQHLTIEVAPMRPEESGVERSERLRAEIKAEDAETLAEQQGAEGADEST